MTRAITADTRIEFVCYADRELPETTRPVFIVRPLRAREHLRVKAIQADTIAERLLLRGEACLGFGLVGWRNFTTEDGTPIPFERKDVPHADQPFLDYLDEAAFIEVSMFLFNGCELDADDLGKSEGPSDSGSSESESARPADE